MRREGPGGKDGMMRLAHAQRTMTYRPGRTLGRFDGTELRAKPPVRLQREHSLPYSPFIVNLRHV